MVEIGNFLVTSLLTYITIYVMSLAKKKNRVIVKIANKRLEKLREQSIKTITDQKEFLDLKFPKKPKFIFKWGMIVYVIGYILLAGGIFYGYSILLTYFNLHIKIWMALLIITFLPVIVNLILRKFYLNSNDIWDILR